MSPSYQNRGVPPAPRPIPHGRAIRAFRGVLDDDRDTALSQISRCDAVELQHLADAASMLSLLARAEIARREG